ncbi:hypothetical protein KY290_001328 [Solanum tuberosum]|uniref:Uncharacterized protein n=1 Tax=Solanum tuberosum TaxID=4113 RepID=A0ABQ7WMD6_SOLTU|nr:hypothetical protein KY289_001487 [Solanum tuberosum]KAH0781730.1 hypothetical protein KY290_001328 [Solanum tuberosum]
MAFLMWRLWKFKIPVDDKVRRWEYRGHLGINIARQTLRGTSMERWDTNGRADMNLITELYPIL